MIIYFTFVNFIILFFFQIIFFKILKFKKYWYLISILLFIAIFFYLNKKVFFSNDFFSYLIFNFIILFCYLIFLTLIFNESPTLFFLENSDFDRFKKKGFVKNRLSLMLNDGLLDVNNKITSKGKKLLKISNLLSNIFFKEND